MLIDHEVQHMVQRRDQFVDQLNVSMDDYLRFTGKTDDEIREEMREHAFERLNRSYALTTLAEKEGLEISDQDIDDQVQELISSRGDSKDGEADPRIDLESEEARSSIRESLLVEKSMERLITIAKGELAETKPEAASTAGGDDAPDKGGEPDDAES
jgi:trigger factor